MRAPCIAALGELLVEFICTAKDGHHLRAASYLGPFPSGAPGIFIDQAAKLAGSLGGRAIMVGAVGDDAFGQVLVQRLARDGVDTRLLGVVKGLPTGTAHVSYNSDGSRDFVFNMAQSAAARLPSPPAIVAGLMAAGVGLLHVSGSTLGDPAMRRVVLDCCEGLRARGVAIAMDPNIRAELQTDGAYLEAVAQIIALAEVVLPSEADAEALYAGESVEDWSGRLLAGGARAVVLKRGDQGCIGRDGAGWHAVPAHRVAVVDPTGAGDCFCATFLTLWAAGESLAPALARANAAGALAVMRMGPMEGTSSLAEIDALLADSA